MAAVALSSMSIKVVGTNGQISIGKQFAGRQVLIEEQEPGVWLIRTASVIPDNERWLHTSQASADLQNALTWAQVYRDKGLKWEKIVSIKPPQGIESLYSLRITQSGRATAYREGDFMRLLTVAPNHDSTYGKK
jgi:hypothetical protein